MTVDLEAKVAALAAEGVSRTEAAERLGIERRKFYEMCRLMPAVIWPEPNKSNRDRIGQARRASAMRNKPTN